ncbi:hypothetical protein ABZ990_27455 [Streptomyces sp. NPDC046203]|uniref:hypothetical protein n=1 Tax=Streptomyces sp. NPDC046203 TaxID=3154602 RepID=UPI00340E2804
MTTGSRERRWRPGLRVLTIVAVVLGVLAGAGWLAKPVWQPWWYAKTLCGGHLSGGELAELLPDERLQAGTDTFGSGQDLLTCSVRKNDGRHFVLMVEAQTDTGDPHGPLDMEFTIPGSLRYGFPKSVPGFYGRFGPVIIQECPKLGRAADGRMRRLVTKVYSHAVENDPSPASLRTAVRIANGANTELGCGADPLPLPDGVDPGHKLRVSETKGTMCEWLTRQTLPESPSGKEWRVVAPTDAKAPITTCSLVDTGTGNAENFSGWYGDWTDKPFSRMFAANVRLPEDIRENDPLLSEDFGRAKALCAGESASFLAADHTTNGAGPILPMSEVRPLLDAFAKDQAKRRGCADLRLPGHTVYPNGR